jgi:hypothetical protein
LHGDSEHAGPVALLVVSDHVELAESEVEEVDEEESEVEEVDESFPDSGIACDDPPPLPGVSRPGFTMTSATQAESSNAPTHPRMANLT